MPPSILERQGHNRRYCRGICCHPGRVKTLHKVTTVQLYKLEHYTLQEYASFLKIPEENQSFKLSFQFDIAGLQVMSQRPCWGSRTKALLSAGKWTLFCCKISRKVSFVLTANMAALSRGWKPRTSDLDLCITMSSPGRISGGTNKRSFREIFCLCPLAWRRWRNMKTKNTLAREPPQLYSPTVQ